MKIEETENKEIIKIEFGMEEYFDQLILMEKQYGQETDLGPWIYMLLLWAELEKKKEKGEKYTPVSIRDVHNMKKPAKHLNSYKNKERQSELDKICKGLRLGDYPGDYSAAPDLAIISDTTIIGCVEIKKLGGKLFENTPEYVHKYDSTNFNSFLNGDFSNNGLDGDRGEIFYHLKKSSKVLYTNGLEFYWFKVNVNEDKNEFTVEKLADLTDLYEEYKEYKEKQKEYGSENKDKAQWNVLLKKLMEISWSEEPSGPVDMIWCEGCREFVDFHRISTEKDENNHPVDETNILKLYLLKSEILKKNFKINDDDNIKELRKINGLKELKEKAKTIYEELKEDIESCRSINTIIEKIKKIQYKEFTKELWECKDKEAIQKLLREKVELSEEEPNNNFLKDFENEVEKKGQCIFLCGNQMESIID